MRNALVVVSMLLLSGCGPRDYDDCILENMKGVNNKEVAGLIVQSCMEKFPVKQDPIRNCALRNMTMDELLLVEVKKNPSYSHYLSLSVFNHNDTSELREITVSINAANFQLSQLYTASTFAGPRSGTNSIGIPVAEAPREPWDFILMAAKTCLR